MGEYFFGITDKGRCRESNEDTFIVSELPGKSLLVACVIDGVGGYSGGEVAAAIARDIIFDQLKNSTGELLQTLRNAVLAANNKIRDEKKKDDKNVQMACVLTCAIIDIRNNKLCYAHVGDTRLYLLRDRSLVKLSKDHSIVGFLEESGRLSEEEAMRHPRRNEITKALGFDEINEINDFIETGESPFLPGDIMLICSDGLSDMIPSNTILSILLNDNSLAERGAGLVHAANEAGGHDNITAVIVQNNNQPVLKVALKPSDRKKLEEKSGVTFVKATPEVQTAVPVRPTRNRKGFIILVLLCSIAILLFQKSTRLHESPALPKAIMLPKPNENLLLLMNAANDSSTRYSIAKPDSLTKLTAPLMIGKDSFYLSGNGVIMSPASNYKGVAILIQQSAKQIVLDGIVFKDFDIAVVAHKNNIVFKNVRFINCRVPVAYELLLPDTTISGRLKDSVFIPVSNFKQL